MKYRLPPASKINRENVQRMNGTSWRQLAVLAAGLSIEEQDGGAGAPDAGDRQRAAEIIERALGCWQENVIEAMRNHPGFGDVVSAGTSLEDWMHLQREGLRGLHAGLKSDGIQDAIDAVGQEAVPAMIELTRNIMLAYEVARLYRQDGAALTAEAFLSVWHGTLFETWEESGDDRTGG